MSDLDFILAVRELSISKICKENEISYPNLVRGRTTKEKEKIVADELKLKINNLYSSIVLDRMV